MTVHTTIQHEATPQGGRYLLQLTGIATPAVLDYEFASDQRVIASHTHVPEAMRGQGAGLVLVKQLMTDARREGWRIVPRCSYVRVQAQRHPEWADIVDFT